MGKGTTKLASKAKNVFLKKGQGPKTQRGGTPGSGDNAMFGPKTAKKGKLLN